MTLANEQNGVSMTELVLYIARNLVDNPDEVKVNEKQEEGALVIELSVGPDDMGKVIGKQGRIAKAIRTVVKAASAKQDIKCSVEIV